MTNAKFIAFEGGEGTGKSTQARLLAEALKMRGFEVESTREPGGTPGGEAIRKILLDPPDGGWNPRAEALLFAAARSDHVERLILPALAADRWVVCDRFVDSSRAYQGVAGGLGDAAINALHTFGSAGLRPDLTILITTSSKAVMARLTARDSGVSDAIGGRGAEYHSRVADGFLSLAAQDPAGFAVIDGDGSPQEVHERVVAAVSSLLGEEW